MYTSDQTITAIRITGEAGKASWFRNFRRLAAVVTVLRQLILNLLDKRLLGRHLLLHNQNLLNQALLV